MKNHNQNWKNDFSLFLATDSREKGKTLPTQAEQQILSSIGRLLNPNPFTVFFKVLALHTVISSLSLSVCHQFGMNPFKTSASLSDLIMTLWGHGACMFFCGVIFVSFSVFFAGIFLSIEELNSLKNHKFIQILALGSLSLVTFAIFGAELVFTFSGFWLLGALIGGLFATEISWFLKKSSAY